MQGPDEIKTDDGREFHRLAVLPHRRLDGAWTGLAVWHSACAACGAAFFVQTPVHGMSKSFGRKHCDAHKLTPEQVAKRLTEARMQKGAR